MLKVIKTQNIYNMLGFLFTESLWVDEKSWNTEKTREKLKSE